MITKNVLKFIILASSCFFCLDINAQSCKPDKESIDKFTKRKVAVYDYDLKDGKVSLIVTFKIVVVDDTIIIGYISYHRDVDEKTASLQPIKISKGQSMFLANENSNIELKCMDDALSTQSVNLLDQKNVTSEINARYMIRFQDLEMLSKEIFSDIQIKFDQTNPLIAKFKKKVAEKLKRDMECLLAVLHKSSK